jgi:hypothetical protein
MHNGYRVSFPVVKWLGHGVNHPFASYYTAYEDGKDSVFRMLAHKIQIPGNRPQERIQHSEQRKFEKKIKKRSYTSVPPLGFHGLF